MNFLLSDLPHDLIHDKIGAYLLNDPNKTIHKIFKGKKDDDLQILLFGKVNNLTYVYMYKKSYNDIDYPMNNIIKDYVNYILKSKGLMTSTCEKMKLNFYNYQDNDFLPEHKLYIIFHNKKGKYIASIEKLDYPGDLMRIGRRDKYVLSYRRYNESYKQYIGKSDIIQEYDKIYEEIKEKYF